MRTILAVALLLPTPGPDEPVRPVREWIDVRPETAERGLHDASLSGRVVDPEGEPVEDAAVVLLPDEGPQFVLAEDRTDADGRFRFEGVGAKAGLLCQILPPDNLRPARYLAAAISHRMTDLGDLTVHVNTRVTGRVEFRDVDGATVEHEAATVHLRPLENPPGVHRGSIARATVDDEGGFVLEHFEAEPVELGVSVPGKTPTTYRGEIEIEPGELGRYVLVTCLEATVERERTGRIGRCEVRDLGTIEHEARPQVTRGRVTLADGTPLAHAAITSSGWGRLAGVEADAEGWFELDSSVVFGGALTIATPGGSTLVYAREGLVPREQRNTARVVPPDPWMDIVLRPVASLEPELVGEVERGELLFEWWNRRAWRPVPEGLLGTVLGEHGRTPLRARRPGSLPAVAHFGAASSVLEFDFSGFEPRRLEVVSSGRPVADVEVWIETLSLGLARVRAADGVLDLSAAAGVDYTAHVSAPGHAAVDVRLPPGTTRVELDSMAGELRVGGLGADEELHVVRAGESVAVVRLRLGSGPIRLPAGDYDALVVRDGALRRGRSFRITGATLELDVSTDTLPRVVLSLPALPALPEPGPGEQRHESVGRWWASATRAIPPMGAVHGMVSTTTGSWRDPQVRTSTVASAEQRLELRLPGRGTYVLSCGAPVSLDHWLVRHVEVGPGQVLELEVPLADARLTGRLDRYHGEQGFSHHGIASPRLFLDGEVPEGPGWSLMVAMPERGADDRFELDPVPAGTYYTMHHLVDGDPIYGGAEVTVATGETGVIEGFGEAPRGAIRVRCVDANGDPVSGEVVIADPMWESWSEFQRYPTTARYASDRIPAPRPVDLVAGEAELAGVQAGLLRLEVRREDGRRYAYRVRTEPSATIVLLAP